jgi:restriction endonuclease S subunit
MPYTVPQNIDPNKIFLVNFSELEGRLDPEQCHKERIDAINRIKGTKKYYPLSVIASFDKTITTEINTSVVYVGLENIESEYGNYIETSEKQSISSAAIFHKTDVLFPKLRPYLNKVFYASFDGICSTEFYVLKASSLVLPEYLAIFLRSSLVVNQTKHLMTGNTLPRLQTEDVKKLLVPVPPLHIQQQIVNVYNAALSQRKKKLNESKSKLASIDQYLLGELGITLPSKTAYYEDFVCSEPTAVYHKVNEYELDQNNLLVQNGQIFTTMFSEVCGGRIDPLANNPTLKAIRKRLSGSSFVPLKQVVKESNEVTNDIIKSDIYVGLENIESNTGNYIVTKEKDTISSALRFKKGQILFPKLRPYLNKVYFAEFEGICSTEFHVLSAHNIDSRYLQYCLLSKLTLEQTTSLMTGNTLPRLQSSDIANIQIPAPSPSKQREIADYISAIRAEAKALEQEANVILEQAKKKVEELILGYFS